ncbi:universal stress protein [Colwellia psychrerythraea]|uniref:UspA domain-containing protein n=1 Tax=Colwellia psychrerythraea TaxID=28229 RepID=A0A099KT84_COLPS|nr:universal stress protein [Colwellia psychrerythraea]KGJ93736.1 UspA domain-containing protein [Colwellia psychrerythraea]
MSKSLYLVAVDGGEWGNRAADRAIHLAEKTRAKVKLVTVVDWPYLHPMIIEDVAPPVLDKEAEEIKIKTKVLTPLVEKYNSSTTNITTELLWGDPAVIIKEQVAETHAVMLFVGRQGRSSIFDALFGSVANKLAHTVGVPIVLVP